ncbi:transporter substrate-binding domain-containing protein (plasmid) [Arthrobacter sp. UC242_113]|uniref:transporter substrate-binding domain-containing protein n=1 Tax=Arthrobacter sp. UC242_113 TaxID=3374550 RepID=UPI0037580A3C
MTKKMILARRQLLHLGAASISAAGLAAISACATPASNGAGISGESNMKFKLVETMKQRGHAILGMVDSPPSSWVQADGSATGYNVEIAKRLLAKYDIHKIEPFSAEFAGMIPGLQAGRMDICIAGMLITDARCETLAMSAATNAMSFSLLTKDGNPDALKTIADVKKSGAKLAVEGATAQERIVRAELEDSQVVIVGDRQGGADAVRIGRANAYVLPVSSAKQVVQAPGAPLTIVERVADMPVIGSALAMRTQDADFANAFREDFKEMVASGEYAEIMKKFDSDPTTLDLPGVQLTC